MIGTIILGIIALYLLIGIGYIIYALWIDPLADSGFLDFKSLPFGLQMFFFAVGVLLWPYWWVKSK